MQLRFLSKAVYCVLLRQNSQSWKDRRKNAKAPLRIRVSNPTRTRVPYLSTRHRKCLLKKSRISTILNSKRLGTTKMDRSQWIWLNSATKSKWKPFANFNSLVNSLTSRCVCQGQPNWCKTKSRNSFSIISLLKSIHLKSWVRAIKTDLSRNNRQTQHHMPNTFKTHPISLETKWFKSLPFITD